MSLSRRGFLLTSASAGALRLAADLPFLRVGWVGNDSWASEMRDRIKRSCAASPLIESVAADGFLVPLAGFDAYVIADWDVLRGPLPMRLVTSRKPVYFRPGAMECLGDAPELIRTASANGTYLHFALPHRNDSMYRQARDWVRSGVIGPIERAESWWNTSGDSPIAASALRECLALRMDALRFLLDTEAPADWAAST